MSNIPIFSTDSARLSVYLYKTSVVSTKFKGTHQFPHTPLCIASISGGKARVVTRIKWERSKTHWTSCNNKAIQIPLLWGLRCRYRHPHELLLGEEAQRGIASPGDGGGFLSK